MAENLLDPSGNLNTAFMKLAQSITIKYYSEAKKYETVESKMKADGYLDALNKLDNFSVYTDYTVNEMNSVGITDVTIINRVNSGEITAIPMEYRDALLKARRQREIDLFEEQNNYYRYLNGYPNIEDNDYFYASSLLVAEYDIDKKIPIHKIQDYYNKQEEGKGDYLISVIEGSGYIDDLILAHPDKKYLNFIGSNRVDIYTARSSKNFQIIQIKRPDVRQSILDTFIRIYEQCREYFVKTIYIPSYSKFIDHYDNFIGLCIMIMTLQQLAVKQITLGIKRDFFDIYAVKALYEMYDIPFNLNIDEDTQSDIVQNLNLLIQNKATDKVLYNIADLLGFSNINVYKYYLTKEHKVDLYNVPIFKYTEKFNSDTGLMEVVPDYDAMYDLYFQKYELKNEDFINSFKDKSNRVEYEDIVPEDPYWWEDQHVYEMLWETEYNAVESKYLSLGISYSMTEIIFENIVFLKLMLQEQDIFKGITIKLPSIVENTTVSLFDTVILLLCLTASKHKLYGEIISIPTQVISVVDYIENTERGEDATRDTFTFNYNYFFHPNDYEDKDKMNEMKDKLIEHFNVMNKEDKGVVCDGVGFNYDYFSLDNKDREKNINELKSLLGEEDYIKFVTYVEQVSKVSTGSNNEKIQALNEMFSGIKGLRKLINYYMTKTHDLDTYTTLKRIYKSLFISKEVCDVFTINIEVVNEDTEESETYTRTAWTFFEYLYHKNPKLYRSIFSFNMHQEYLNYLSENKISSTELSFYQFSVKAAKGEIFLNYGKLINDEADDSIRDERLYFYINHIISRLEMILDELKFLYLMNDSATPLETLLLQLVRFFKSYTVDILGLNTLFINDLKPENTMKFFDKIHYIEKTIQSDDKLELSYGDVIHDISSTLEANQSITFTDKLKYTVNLLIDELYGNRNSVRMNDLINTIQKEIQVDDKSIISMHDEVKIESSFINKDKSHFSDKIVKMWYTD